MLNPDIYVAEGQSFVILKLRNTNYWLDPNQARAYAKRLEQAAEQAERGPVPVFHREAARS